MLDLIIPHGVTGPVGSQNGTEATRTAGPAGITGAAGTTGPVGTTGATGATGATEPTGPTGATDAAGAIGTTGATGAAGNTGPEGPAGPTDTTGATGAAGVTDNVGTEGPVGATDATGDIGSTRAIDDMGSEGPTGPAGETGLTGAATIITIGGVTTDDPDTEASVANSDTSEDAVFDFVIPREESGGGGVPEVLTVVDTTPQPTSASGTLIFNETPLVSRTAIAHVTGSPGMQINQPGIYRAFFAGIILIDAGATISSTLTVQPTLSGVSITGATVHHTFTASNEEVALSMDAPPPVAGADTLEVVTSDTEYTSEDTSSAAIHLGDSTNFHTAV